MDGFYQVIGTAVLVAVWAWVIVFFIFRFADISFGGCFDWKDRAKAGLYGFAALFIFALPWCYALVHLHP